jgi:hypothetical protein
LSQRGQDLEAPEAELSGAPARRLRAREKGRTMIKKLTRLALALTVATLASLAPMAYADDDALPPTPSGVIVDYFSSYERNYDYEDEDGYGTMVVSDGPKYSWGRPISVTLYQNGYTFYGEGKRKYSNSSTGYLAYCEFWLYDGPRTLKFKGYIPVFEDYSSGYGSYWFNENGTGLAHSWQVGPPERSSDQLGVRID